MKKPIACLTAAVLFSAALAGGAGSMFSASAEGPVIDVWLIGGQSNAVGYAQGLPESNDDARFTEGFDNVLFWGEYESDVPAAPSDFVPVKAGFGKAYSNSDKRSGAELGIASALGDSGGMNAVIKYAWGATFLYPDTTNNASTRWGTWTPPSYREEHGVSGGKIGLLYDNFLGIVAEGLTKLEAQGYTPVIRGMWWMQGEAESPKAEWANAYYELLSDLISDLRSDLTETTGQDCTTMPFVLGKIYRNPDYSQQPHIDTVREAQQRAAESVPNVAAVDCTGLAQQDGWHFTADAQLWLGEQFVRQVGMMDGKYWVSCSSENIAFSGGGVKEQGDSVTVTVTAQRGYRIGTVSMQTGTAEPQPVTLTNGRYSFVMPQENVVFTVTTEALPLYRLTDYSVNDGAMGTVYPSAEARAGWYEGESAEVFVRPAEGYAIGRVTANGAEISPVREQSGGFVYELDTAADVVFYAEFVEDSAVTPTPPDSGNGDRPDVPQSNNTGLWIGIGAGGAVLVAVIAALAVILRKKRG